MPRTFSSKIKPPKALKLLLSRQKKGVVFTNGCFDLLHVGHVTYLEKARALGSLLVVAVNSDSSVKKLKGPTRPINPLKDRMKVLAALECVDYVTSFSTETPSKLIEFLSPNVLVKGGDYTPGSIAGADWVLSHGGAVKIISFVKGKSTTALLKKSRQ